MYEENFVIRASQVDNQQKLKTGPAIDLFQDVEASHIVSLEEFNKYNSENNIAIVIAYRQFDILKKPKYQKQIKIDTKPHQTNSFYGFRESVMYEDGKPIICANTVGAFVDLTTNKPNRVPKNIINAIGNKPQVIKTKLNRKIDLINLDSNLVRKDKVYISKSFIDYYNHVNNAYYIVFAENLLPSEYTYRQIRCEYLEGLKLGDTALLELYQGSNGLYQVIIKSMKNDVVSAIVEFNQNNIF